MTIQKASPKPARTNTIGMAGASLAGVAALIALPYVTPSYAVSIGSLVLIAAILASAINMLAGDAGLVSLGHAGIAGAAGYGLAWASRQGWDLGGQLVLALVITLIVSMVYALISMRTNGIFFLMITLAAGMICYGLAYRWSAVTGGDNGLVGIRRPELVAESWQFYFLCVAAFVIVTIALRIFSHSPVGLVLRGLRDSESRMVSLGYQVAAYKFWAVLASGIVAGLAGVLSVWQMEFIAPNIADFQASALPLIMIVIGGVGSLLGPAIGAVIVVLGQQVVSTYFERWSLLLGLVFIVVVIFAPRGIVGAVAAASRRVRRRSAAADAPASSMRPPNSPSDPTPNPPSPE